ncbi:class I SAM-dependent methyltransferase [Thioalkalivibrio sulfidiphilus]|uniref:class I SAM-dependent methyltransferase n=1 Tax=Thioalkalivibrio sulfidiphilus TaxID=1033854 RepID=UPI000399A50C|nr:class I SAM-dependent methyltransferase [Thioalkalivibrio sulfidiphilus]
MSPIEDYAEEAAFYESLLVEACDGTAASLLELGSGGGNNAWYLKRRFAMTLVDLSPGMLAVSRQVNPECEHLQGDMRDIRLDRQFDCVFVQDAVSHMNTEKDLRMTMETAFLHCRPGGVTLFMPDAMREHFRPSTDCGGHDDGVRGLRYLEWTWDPDPDDSQYTVDFTYLIRDEHGTVSTLHDRFVLGLFSRQEWLNWLEAAGFQAHALPMDIDGVEPGRYEVFVARRPVS